jgi:hypothetical protein
MAAEPDPNCLYGKPTGIGALRRRLKREGWFIQDSSTGIHVINPEIPALEEHITLIDRTDGRWFAYGWGEPFAPAHDIDMAITSIRQVLGTHRQLSRCGGEAVRRPSPRGLGAEQSLAAAGLTQLEASNAQSLRNPTITSADLPMSTSAEVCDHDVPLPGCPTRRLVRLSDIPLPERAARRYIAEAIEGRLTADQRYAAELVVSELVTNAFHYGRPPIDLALCMNDKDRLFIEVSDADPTPPTPRLPCESGGFGLSIVSAYADISVVPTETGKIVSAHFKSSP